jgi:hypothetical protein
MTCKEKEGRTSASAVRPMYAGRSGRVSDTTHLPSRRYRTALSEGRVSRGADRWSVETRRYVVPGTGAAGNRVRSRSAWPHEELRHALSQ